MLRFTASDIERIAKALDNAPRISSPASKFEAIGKLSSTIATLRARGHRLDSIVSMLAEHNLPISVGTLKTYLRRLKKRQTSNEDKPGHRDPKRRAKQIERLVHRTSTESGARASEHSSSNRSSGSEARGWPFEDTEEI